VFIYQITNDHSGLEEAAEQLLGRKGEHHLVNWSNTHECWPRRFYEPESQEELERIVAEAHEKGTETPSLLLHLDGQQQRCRIGLRRETCLIMRTLLCHQKTNCVMPGEKLRVMGSGLSPNGLPFSDEGIVSLALMDKIKFVDLQKRRITVEAGVRVEQVLSAEAMEE
jgi:L-galactono-1,4-lactone dehydrogenase